MNAMAISVLMFVLESATFALIAAIAFWAFSPRRRKEFEQAALLPFQFDTDSTDAGNVER